MNNFPVHLLRPTRRGQQRKAGCLGGRASEHEAQSGNAAPIHRRETDGPLIVVRLTNFTAPGASAPGQHEEQ